MHSKWLLFLPLLLSPLALRCQRQDTAPYHLYGGFTYFSNSFNGVPQFRSPLLGWDSAVEFPSWKGLRFKIDVSGTTGENYGASQRALFILGGPEYGRYLGRERVFAHALFGDARLTRYWGPDAHPGMTASFAYLLGGGVDTPLGRHFSLRAEGDLQHTNLGLVQSISYAAPYHFPGQPDFMGRFSTGLVWTPRAESDAIQSSNASRAPVASELVTRYDGSFGHFHIFAGTWWSYLHVGGLEYDRHTWGTFLRARLDYVAEVLPVVVLQQPTFTDIFGDPYTPAHSTVMGLGASPIGVRMLWREGRSWKPYYIAKGGMIGFTEKVLSKYASYEDFTLQQSTGVQFRINDEWDVRAGVTDFHFSNAFLVPSNPGIDEMMYSVGLSRRFHTESATR